MQYSHNGQAMSKLSVPAGAWEELRREARKLEGEVDGKLANYAKFASGPAFGMGVSDALLAGDSLDATAADIEGLLQRLNDVNEAMSGAVAGGDAARSHTLARHRDILLEFTQEFRRVKNNVTQSREHAMLLGGRSGGGGGGAEQFGGSSAGSQLIRERSTIHSSTSKVDEVISQAQATAAALVDQRGIFMNVANNLGSIASRFPVVNNMLTAIKRKKSKDTMILSAVVAICTAFTVIYWLSK
mmetsp:Transcript_33895/g.83134  ORF Transcript_33895/g.83134 Transcript_33895/m.83134 type:complete len:243 (-) Transcript_33895:141-869(-)|eukprot:CAMPEP_0197600190 /NCGR_PEP_ID=MMETSP1326-20131121/32808_1 /TAXON_ID=1155430 /ORGANISM="Genus nov. species nov., Strain RCC2288" /LENGTH=242 /DNA_ID=CAMNT_0043167259 /DNA_START=232 /DNA_END=960 /DNA_ORIENTATION=+